MANTFKKYTAGVYCMESDNSNLQHGDEAIITTRRGKEVEVIVWKRLCQKNDKTYYSVVRCDGFNRTEWTRRRMERAERSAAKNEQISADFFEKSKEGHDFLVLGEPIKVGHHSEKKHRALIERNHKRMEKAVEAMRKVEGYQDKADTLQRRLAKEINLDTPDSLEQLKQRVEDLETQRQAIKSREHERWELSNLGANIRRYKKRLETAQELWELPEELEKDQANG